MAVWRKLVSYPQFNAILSLWYRHFGSHATVSEFVGFCRGYIDDLVMGERYADAGGLLSVILRATEDPEVRKLTELLLINALLKR